MTVYSEQLIQKTKDTFEPKYGRVLTQLEVEEIIDNMTAFAELLIEGYQREKQKEKIK